MWKDYFQGISKDCIFSTPATKDEIDKVESLLNVSLPQEFKEIIFETNGVKESGLGLIWPLERIINENKHYRDGVLEEYYMPFGNLVFFADSGIGDLFAFPVAQDGVCRDDVFVWNHINDSRMWVAPSVTTYAEWWLNGNLEI
ncbi:hypothetical protein J2W91_004701 [Paenibacillus amylolyticus]|uniref:Knr4/Smi1-like domain-containing protein n=1 Tax=Paenibacillus amylolyticus TaxID=1451 RepID=A0AAP5H4H1_PAEAM|nr:SMI1/KNR4 family protein [Paenibacillus amylolyticus]MDR6726195.1 hypothetical protein [Paenibacillus amylolyticus]